MWYEVLVCKQRLGTLILVFKTELCAWLGSSMHLPFSISLYAFPDICNQFFSIPQYLREQLGVPSHFLRHDLVGKDKCYNSLVLFHENSTAIDITQTESAEGAS